MSVFRQPMDFTDRLLLTLTTQQPQQEFYDSSWKSGGSLGIRINRGKGEKLFFLLYSVNGKRRRYPLGRFPTTPVEDARIAATKIITRVRAGEDPLLLRKLRNLTIEDVFGRFINTRELAEKTKREYLRLFSQEVLPYLKARRVDSIAERELKRLLYILAEERHKPALANRVRALLSAIFNFALEAGLCDENPLIGIPPSSKERRESLIKNVASLEELYSFFERSEGDVAGSVVRFSLLSGVSLNEVRTLRWSDLRGEFWETRRGYLVNLTQAHRAILSAMRSGSEHIFAPPYKSSSSLLKKVGAAQYSPTELERSIQQAMLKVGIPFTEHSLVFGKLRPPENSLREWAARKLFSEWVALLTSPDAPEQGKVVRLRRFKRLK